MSNLEQETNAAPPFLERYQPVPGAYDELLDGDRRLRPHWHPLLAAWQGLTSEDFGHRGDQVTRLVREHGSTYNVYSDAQGRGRPWPLDTVPLILPAHEWTHIEAGLAQRARLLNEVLADFYGPQTLLQEGLIPPALLFANPGFLRPCHGIKPLRNAFLFFHAVDLVRSPDGNWWVMGDRTQAPSGAGYSVENRLVISRVFPEEFRQCQAQRLAGFFESIRETLRAFNHHRRDNPKVVLLTPGPYNETYSEQVFLARYLSFPLVEGADLTVRGGRVYLKTLEGLDPVDVILRRLDDSFCDPLCLRADSALGVPGLVQAARAGNVTIANALGSGAIEMPALMAFLPGLCRRLLGEELRLPNVATWWCGEASALAYVEAHLDQLVIKRSFAPAASEPVFGSRLNPAERERLVAAIRRAPYEYVGQEQVSLSSAPVWADGKLESRRIALRTFVSATTNGYSVMPGALTRYSSGPGRLVVSMQSGGGSKDTWVLSDAPVSQVSLLKPLGQIVRFERSAIEVPSRVADNLFWLGRYSERLEDIVRVLRCVLSRLTGETGKEESPELRSLIRLLVKLDLFPARFREQYRLAGIEREVYQLIYQTHRLGTVREVAGRLRNLAFVLRDRFSADTWNILSKLQVLAWTRPTRIQPTEALALLDALVVNLAAFSGMEMENMTRGHGWRFLDFGRRLERAANVVSLLQSALELGADSPATLEPVLEIADSTMTYRRRYFAQPYWPAVLDLLVADESNPRSLGFQVHALLNHAVNLPGGGALATVDQLHLHLTEFEPLLQPVNWPAWDPATPEDPAPSAIALLSRTSASLRNLSDTLTQLYFSHAQTSVS